MILFSKFHNRMWNMFIFYPSNYILHRGHEACLDILALFSWQLSSVSSNSRCIQRAKGLFSFVPCTCEFITETVGYPLWNVLKYTAPPRGDVTNFYSVFDNVHKLSTQSLDNLWIWKRWWMMNVIYLFILTWWHIWESSLLFHQCSLKCSNKIIWIYQCMYINLQKY